MINVSDLRHCDVGDANVAQDWAKKAVKLVRDIDYLPTSLQKFPPTRKVVVH